MLLLKIVLSMEKLLNFEGESINIFRKQGEKTIEIEKDNILFSQIFSSTRSLYAFVL